MADEKLKEAQEKYADAKAWGQEKGREADQAKRDLKKLQDVAASAAETEAENASLKDQLAAAVARSDDLVAEVAAADKRAKKVAAKAERFDAIKSALGV